MEGMDNDQIRQILESDGDYQMKLTRLTEETGLTEREARELIEMHTESQMAGAFYEQIEQDEEDYWK